MSESACGLLVVAGEPSGDRIAAAAVRALGARVRAFGIGGDACEAAGVALLGHASRVAAMGGLDVAERLPRIAAYAVRTALEVRRRRPRIALLANYTELNAIAGRRLRAFGARVVWCVAPQVWAWRPGRMKTLRGAVDRLAVILPFEQALWRSHGFDATYVGHPALDALPRERAALRAALGIAPGARAVAVLPGSRTGEVRRLARDLCEAACLLRARGAADTARVFAAPSLAPEARRALDDAARERDLDVFTCSSEEGASAWLGAFDVALTASGTASLEAALAGAPPVVTYRTDALTFALAERLVTTPHIALPNVLLRRRAYPELVQTAVSPDSIARAAEPLLADRARFSALAAELRELLAPGRGGSVGARIAELTAAFVA